MLYMYFVFESNAVSVHFTTVVISSYIFGPGLSPCPCSGPGPKMYELA